MLYRCHFAVANASDAIIFAVTHQKAAAAIERQPFGVVEFALLQATHIRVTRLTAACDRHDLAVWRDAADAVIALHPNTTHSTQREIHRSEQGIIDRAAGRMVRRWTCTVSLTTMRAFQSTQMPVGESNLQESAAPSKKPRSPVPAIVVTSPVITAKERRKGELESAEEKKKSTQYRFR
jgi:hypothetical protein